MWLKIKEDAKRLSFYTDVLKIELEEVLHPNDPFIVRFLTNTGEWREFRYYSKKDTLEQLLTDPITIKGFEVTAIPDDIFGAYRVKAICS